jgi:hypothetical protein
MPGRGVFRQEDFRMDYAALAGAVAGFAIVLAFDEFRGAVRGGVYFRSCP